MSKPSTRTRPPASARPAPHRGRRPVRSGRLLTLLAGVVLAMAAMALAIGVASRSGTKAPAVAQSREITFTGNGLPTYAAGGADPAVGQTIPALRGEDFDGHGIQIAPDGTPKLIFFVAHWCPHCRAEVPRIVDWLGTGRPQGVQLVAVSSGVNPDLPNYPPSSWLAREGWTVPTIADDTRSTAGTLFGLSGYPYFVAVDAQGRVAARASGELSVAEIEGLVAAARG